MFDNDVRMCDRADRHGSPGLPGKQLLCRSAFTVLLILCTFVVSVASSLFHSTSAHATASLRPDWVVESSVWSGDSFQGVVFADDQNGWVLTSSRLFATHDGGTTWQQQNIGTSFSGGYSINRTNTGALYISNNQSLYRSSDNGSTWQTISAPETYQQVVVPSPGTIYGIPYGCSSRIDVSVNDGATWQSVQAPGCAASLYMSDLNNGTLYTSNDRWYQTADGGVTWTAVNHSGWNWATFDRGVSWTQFPLPQGQNASQLGVLSSTTALATDGSSIWSTQDGGQTWHDQTVPVNLSRIIRVGYRGSTPFALASDGSFLHYGSLPPTLTSIPTNSPTSIPTATPLPTNSPTSTRTNTPTLTPPPTHTPTATATQTPTNTPTDTPSPTDTPTPTDTSTSTPSTTPTDTPTETSTVTPIPTATSIPVHVTLFLASTHVVFGHVIHLRVTLTAGPRHQKLSNQPLSIQVGSQIVHARTDHTGQTHVDIPNVANSGAVGVTVTYTGDGVVNATGVASGTYTSVRVHTQILDLGPIFARRKQTITLHARVLDRDLVVIRRASTAPAGDLMTFQVGHQTIKARIGGNGTVTATIILAQPAGSYFLVARYSGNSRWAPQQLMVPFIIGA